MHWKDLQFWLAMGAALPVWGALLAFAPHPALDLAWPLDAPASFLLLALVYPVAEEIIFRGALQEWLGDHLPSALGPLSLANLGTSIVFAALHFIYHPPLWAASVFVPSLLFGYFKDRTGSLQAPILLHIFYNTGYFWLLTGG